MKYLSTNSSVLLLVAALVMLACSNNESPSGTNTTTPATPAVPLQNTTAAAGVDHYTCPNGHAGAAAAGNCAVCGVALEHNQAYHNNQPATTPNISTTPTTPTTTAATPAQNAAGEYHYACPNGHAGAAAAGSCAVCGTALAHNQAYHNTPGTVSPTTGSATPAASGSGPTFAPMLQDNAGTPAARVQPQTTTATTPAKNAAGQYHYTCPNGHAGAAAAGNCSVCGSALTHNPAYHN